MRELSAALVLGVKGANAFPTRKSEVETPKWRLVGGPSPGASIRSEPVVARRWSALARIGICLALDSCR